MEASQGNLAPPRREGGGGGLFPTAPRNYALSGKIMLSAIVVLFAIVLLILCLHVYARWFLLRSARRRRRERRRLVFAAEFQDGAGRAAVRGLDGEVIKSLPVFTYKAGESEPVECAVCLSDFQDDEKGRVMPLCKHRFHTECIDMWFHSHVTCPLCRAAVEPPAEPSVSVHIHVDAPSLADLCESCRHESGDLSAAAAAEPSSSSSSSSSSTSAAAAGAAACSGSSLAEEVESPGGGGQGLKSPLSRMRSLKRLLSIDLRFYRGGSDDPDLERGGGAMVAEEQPPLPAPPRHG